MTRLLMIIGFACLTVVSGCKLPDTTVQAVNERPGVVVANATDAMMLYVDGVEMGQAKRFDGDDDYLQVAPGTHLIEVKTTSGRVLYRSELFFDAELKTIDLPKR